MTSKESKQKDNAVNIHSYPVQMHVGSQKYFNDDWGTMAYIIDRREIQNKFADPELRFNCIYFLFGYENTIEMCYVGQAKKRNNGESVLERLREHDKSTTEKYCDIWDWAVVVTNKNDAWTLDDLNALEHAFYVEIPVEQNLNGNVPNAGGADFNSYTDKIEQIKALVTTIGFSIFASKEQTENIQVISETNEFSRVEDLQNGMARIPEIVTPHKVVKAMVDMLPADVWNDKTVFLDPACKGGEYLREIYDRLMENEVMQSKYPNAIERSNHILSEQIYGIALSQVSLERTTKKLMGFGMNIRVIPNYINIVKAKFARDFTKEDKHDYIMSVLNKEFGKEMKIDVVIGNPPYNDTDETGASKSINTYFVDLALKLYSRNISFIMPNRWFVSPDKLNADCRKSMIGKLRYLRDYKDANECFKGVQIAGGVSYFLYDKDYDGEMIYEDGFGSVNVRHNERFMLHSTSSNILYNHVKEIADEYMDADYISTSFFGLRRNDCGRKNSDDKYNIRLISSREDSYLSIDDIPNNSEYVKYYKVAIQYSAMNPKSFILMPNEVCTLTYLIVKFFNTYDEATNCKKYFDTNFFKVLFDGLKTKLGSTKENFMCIPLQDFTSSSDIDWSQSISDIDKQLYKKYNLSQEEIAYIEKTIKPME